MRRAAGFVLVGLGALIFVWIGVTLRWGDPITSIETRHEQSKLERELDQLNRRWHPTPVKPAPRPAARHTSSARSSVSSNELPRDKGSPAVRWTQDGVAQWAKAFRRTLRRGHAVGRIVVPRLGLRMVIVDGTSTGSLKKGPGLYDIRRRGYATSLPGMKGVVAIAGHRTTYGHPFRYIDTLRTGDRIYIQMPYARFTYRVYRHVVVRSANWEILHPRGFEKLVLSACHPLHSLSHRWVVFAELIRTQPPWV